MTVKRLSVLLVLMIALDPASAEAAPGRRFVAHLDLALVGPPVSPSRCTAPLVLVELEGRGRAARLGRLTAEASHCIVDDPADEGVNDGLLTLVGAAGSLELAYSGTDVDGELRGVFLITGGTGALAGAAGEGTLSGVAVREEDRGFVLLRGRLRLP